MTDETTTIRIDGKLKKKLDKAREQLIEELGISHLSYADVIRYLLREDRP